MNGRYLCISSKRNDYNWLPSGTIQSEFFPYVTYLLITIIRLEEEIVFSLSGEENKVDHRTIRHVLVIDCHLIDLSEE